MLEVRNTSPEDPVVTLFAELKDGSFVARVMREDEVPYGPFWPDALDQRMVYIAPEEDALTQILTALQDRRLPYEQLQDLGSSNGGTTQIPV